MTVFTPSSESVRIYEITVLYPYPIPQKDEQQLYKGINAIFAEADVKILAEDKWGRRGLAYPINGNTEGNYVVYYTEIHPSKLHDLNESLRILPNVLRHIIVKPPKNYEFIKYSEQFEQWIETRGQEEENKKKKEEEKLKSKMLEKQKIQAKRIEKKSQETDEGTNVGEKREISAEIDKLISDDDIEL